jgi:hypothetical protein
MPKRLTCFLRGGVDMKTQGNVQLIFSCRTKRGRTIVGTENNAKLTLPLKMG